MTQLDLLMRAFPNGPFAAALLRTLTNAGLAVLDLAEPISVDTDDTHEFSDGSVAGTVHVHPGDGVVYHGGWEWTYQQARDVARQWLSAAEVAGINTREQETIGIS